jgi:hypothetical protein
MEQIIERDGKLYKVTTYEEEIDLAQEEYKLQAWKDALIRDAQDYAEYQAKIAEIDALDLKEEHKEALKLSVPFYSGSGIRQEQVDAVEQLVTEAKAVSVDIKPTK